MLVIGITGTLGAGKGTMVEYLIKEKGFNHFSVRQFLLEEIRKRNLPENRDSMVVVANELTKAEFTVLHHRPALSAGCSNRVKMQ